MSSSDYFNQLQLGVAQGPVPDLPPTSYFELIIDEPDGGIGGDDLALLTDLARYLALSEDQVPAPYALETSTSHFEWGASGAAGEVLIYIAEIAGAMGIEAMIRVAISRTREMRRGPVRPLDERTAAAVAIQTITRRYDLKATDLTRSGESVTGDGLEWSLSYRTMEDEYRVSVRSIEGSTSVVSVARTTLAPPIASRDNEGEGSADLGG